MLIYDKYDRITAKEALNHEYFKPIRLKVAQLAREKNTEANKKIGILKLNEKQLN